MKILHVCLAAFYIDNYSYQENILPRMHKKLGHDVQILASTETYVSGKKLGYVEPSEYVNEDGILVTRIPYKKSIPIKIAKKLRLYEDFTDYLEAYNPDIIFLHDIQFLSITKITNYAKTHNVRILADGHTDFVNSARNLGGKLLHKYIYKPYIKKAEPYIEHFFGTLPIRVKFMKEIYDIPNEKLSFLPMGADDDLVQRYISPQNISDLYNKYSLSTDDFIIVTGGKINETKTETLLLMEAVNEIDNPNLKLIIFGTIADSLKEKFESLCSDKITYAGWATVEESYQYFSVANLIVFPGTHSVYWEQAAGLGKPLMVKYWEGITHVELGGNAIFLRDDSKDEIKNNIETLINNTEAYYNMKKCAENLGMKTFSYIEIAKRCIK